MDLCAPAGGATGEGVPVPTAYAGKGRSAQCPAGEKPDSESPPGFFLPTNAGGPAGADAGAVRVAGFGVLPDL